MNYVDPRFEVMCQAGETFGSMLESIYGAEALRATPPSVDKPYPKPESMEEERERLWRAVMEFSST